MTRAVRYYHAHRAERVAYATARQQRNKAKAKRLLGGDPPKCVRCGFDDERVLHFDHKHGGGHAERQVKSAYQIREWIIQNPEAAKEKFQLLCANCNYLKALESKEYKRK